uniref:Retrovirus-related Pol polyprotein from transposon TNT 1-94 n=1 Tax=Tanacetum cinerariifolium TaxID=118510 RepID=A0A6L2J6F7_TANCI|nr:hypothetical protein [Tanacetum cinerariifolium]
MKRPNETTYQVVLDALARTPSYPAFLITNEVPTIYMHQFLNTVYKYGSSYMFKIDNKKFIVNVEEFKEILNICLRIEGQEFSDPIYEEEALSFIRHLGHTGEIRHLTDITVDHLHQPWRSFTSIINKCLSGKFLVSTRCIDNKDAKKSDKMYYPRFTKAIIHHYLTKNPSISMRNRMFMHTVMDDTILAGMKFVSKHEAIQVYALSEEAKLKLATKRSMKDYHISQASGLGGDSGKEDDDDEEDSNLISNDSDEDGDNDKGDDDEGGNDDNVKVDDDYAENVDDDEERMKYNNKEEDINLDERIPIPKFHEEEEKNKEEDEEYEDLYGDVNVNLRTKDVDMTSADYGGVARTTSQGSRYEYAEKDAHVTVTTVHDAQKTKGQQISSFVSSDFTSKMLQLENISTVDYTITSIMDTLVYQPSSNVITTTHSPPLSFRVSYLEQEVCKLKQVDNFTTIFESIKSQIPAIIVDHLATRLRYDVQTAFQSYKADFEKEAHAEQDRFIDEISDFATPLIQRTIAESHENVVMAKSSSQPKSKYEETSSLTKFELKKILLDKMNDNKSYLAAPEHKELYDSLSKSYDFNRDLFETYGPTYALKKDQDDKDKDEDPSAQEEFNTGNNDDETGPEAVDKSDWFKKPEKPPTPDREWKFCKSIDFKPPQTWISNIAKDKQTT